MAVQFPITLLCRRVSRLTILALAGIPSVVMLVGLVWVAATLSCIAALFLLGWESF
jgi:hypothetical protein